MATYYSLENAISSFFESSTTVTRQQCDSFALSRTDGRVDPVEIQGSFSYTITAAKKNSKIFQFRLSDSSFDMIIMSLAKAIHPQFVACCKYHGTIGQLRPLHVYEMDKLPGTTYIMARDVSAIQPPDAVLRQRNTVKDLARVRQELVSLFSGIFPFVLNHGDLCEMNFLIDAKTGNITGIVDWAEARILPFGFSLWGLENVLGYMDSKGWHYYDNRRELENLFWQIFWSEASNVSHTDLQFIRAARMAGLFYRYGYAVEDKAVKGVRDQPNAYLDAFCTSDDWAPQREPVKVTPDAN